MLKALVEEELLTKAEADKILREAQATSREAEEVIYGRNIISEEEVAKVKSRVLKIPWKKIDAESVSEEVFRLIPAESVRTYRMVPLSRAKDMLVVGMVNPDDLSAGEALRFLAKQEKVNLGVYVATPSDIQAVLIKFSALNADIQAALKAMNLEGGGASLFQKITRLEESSGSASDAPVIRIVASLLKEAVNLQASDIHIEPERHKTRVRFRMNGALEEYAVFPPDLSQPVIARVKVIANLKLDESRIPQDGRFRTVIFEKEIDFRVATFPTPQGEKIALRVLDPAIGLKTLDEIGVIGRSAELLTAAIKKPYGMVLLTGPTGSGKTTTLYALMRILNQDSVNVVSLEDPVEYTIDGVNQSQVKPEIGYDFASGLRQILRQDPDVIMVGEIRDSETAGLAVHAALTGHVMLSTLHTNNAAGVIPRLMDMGVSPFLLPPSLNVMAAQRLVARLCEHCKKEKDAPPSVEAIIKRELSRMPPAVAAKYGAPYKIFSAPGCGRCKGKGVSGRIAIFEVFEMTRELAEIILSSSPNVNRITDETRRQGMITLRQDGILKALSGVVSIEEVLRETEEV